MLSYCIGLNHITLILIYISKHCLMRLTWMHVFNTAQWVSTWHVTELHFLPSHNRYWNQASFTVFANIPQCFGKPPSWRNHSSHDPPFRLLALTRVHLSCLSPTKYVLCAADHVFGISPWCTILLFAFNSWPVVLTCSCKGIHVDVYAWKFHQCQLISLYNYLLPLLIFSLFLYYFYAEALSSCWHWKNFFATPIVEYLSKTTVVVLADKSHASMLGFNLQHAHVLGLNATLNKGIYVVCHAIFHQYFTCLCVKHKYVCCMLH